MLVGLSHLVRRDLAEHVAESRAFYAARGERRGPASLEELLELRDRQPPRLSGPVTVVEVSPGVQVRIVMPQSAPARGVHLDLPGGGFYLSSAAAGDARNAQLADRLGVAVVSVDYRLAPEHPWPAAPDDCESAARWLLDEGGARFGTTRLTIGGSSAGATLAVTTLLRLRDKGEAEAFSGALLQFGSYDLSGLTASGQRFADEWFLEAYVGHVADRTLPDVSPVFGDLHGLPPTLLVVGDQDVVLEESLVMAARLSAAGNEVDLRVYPASPHGFTAHPTAMARAALDDQEAWLAGAISGPCRRSGSSGPGS